MNLGIEIGGTKLQLGIGDPSTGELQTVKRSEIEIQKGAGGILEEIQRVGLPLIQKNSISKIGIGFGGPVDSKSGKVITSHQVRGWEDFQLARWCETHFKLPTFVGNDCDTATLAESQFGAGANSETMVFVTVGTGIGGGLAHNGKVLGPNRPSIAEIGHLRPGVHCNHPEMTVESIASGLGIANAARARISGDVTASVFEVRNPAPFEKSEISARIDAAIESGDEYKQDLLARCGGDLTKLTGHQVALAAQDGNVIAARVIDDAITVLGWAIAQVITLVAPNTIVIGGGVSLMGEQEFFSPLRKSVDEFVFPPLKNSFEIVPAALGELVVVHGAILTAENASD